MTKFEQSNKNDVKEKGVGTYKTNHVEPSTETRP